MTHLDWGLNGDTVIVTGGAVTTMTRGMARSWAPLGIRVNALAPGLVDTQMLKTPGQTPVQFQAMVDGIPMKRLAVPEDHVGATVFLCSPMARYMTGATMNVSGGFLMHWGVELSLSNVLPTPNCSFPNTLRRFGGRMPHRPRQSAQARRRDKGLRASWRPII
jgi:hypothetical protein